MKLVSCKQRSKNHIGILTDDGTTVVNLSVASPKLPTDMTEIIAAAPEIFPALGRAAAMRKKEARLKASRVKLTAPIPVPRRNVLCMGKNYFEHAHEFDKSDFISQYDTAAW